MSILFSIANDEVLLYNCFEEAYAMYFAIFQLLIIICCYRAEFSGRNKIFDDYMSRERTTSVKGVFAVIILLSHLLQYVKPAGHANLFAKDVIINIGQLMVTVFFFY